MFWPQGMWDLSSSTRNQTLTSCIGSLNHWTTREVTGLLFYSSFIASYSILLCGHSKSLLFSSSLLTKLLLPFAQWIPQVLLCSEHGEGVLLLWGLPTLWLIQMMAEKALAPRTFLAVSLIFPSVPCTSHRTADLGLTSLVTLEHEDCFQFSWLWSFTLLGVQLTLTLWLLLFPAGSFVLWSINSHCTNPASYKEKVKGKCFYSIPFLP